MKLHGRPNDLLKRLADDPAFEGVDMAAATDARQLIGRSAEQVDQFLAEVVEPIRRRYGDSGEEREELKVLA